MQALFEALLDILGAIITALIPDRKKKKPRGDQRCG